MSLVPWDSGFILIELFLNANIIIIKYTKIHKESQESDCTLVAPYHFISFHLGASMTLALEVIFHFV